MSKAMCRDANRCVDHEVTCLHLSFFHADGPFYRTRFCILAVDTMKPKLAEAAMNG